MGIPRWLTAAALLGLGGFSLLSAAGVARHAEGVGQAPAAQLKVATDQVLQILTDPALKSEAKRGERRQAIRRVADDAFDFEEMAKRTLGPHWQSLSASQRKDFVQLYEDLLEGAYIAIFERYSGEPIKYTGERVEGELASSPPGSSPTRAKRSRSTIGCSR